jgi:hypothetical protein
LQVKYPLTIPRGGSVAIVYGVRQFPRSAMSAPTSSRTVVGTPYNAPSGAVIVRSAAVVSLNPKEVAAALEPFKSKEFVRDLPPEIRKQLINYSAGQIEANAHGAPAQAVAELLEQFGLTRGQSDLLLMEDSSQLLGVVSFGRMNVATAYGEAELTADEIAAVVGGGTGRPMRVLLRNGEVLAGPITAAQFVMTTDRGLRIDLNPTLMNVVVFRESPSTGRGAPSAGAYLTTATGDRLSVQIQSTERLAAATPWGRIVTSLEAVDALGPDESAASGALLWLQDHSRLPVILTGPPLELQTVRWGKVTVSPTTVRRWNRIAPLKKTDDETSEPEFDPLTFAAPHVRLLDDSILVGESAEPEIHLAAAGGLKTVQVRMIRELSRNDDGGFDCKLSDGTEFTGLLNESFVTIRSGDRSLRVPAHQIVFLCGAPNSAAAPK